MTVRFVVLAEEVEEEIRQLKEVKDKIFQGVSLLEKRQKEREFYLDSIAINLHSFYSGVENIFRSIASKVDGDIPSGERWHSDLLIQMTTPLLDIRPAVITVKIKEDLKDLLAFRHLIRNIYTFQLDEELVLRLATKLSKISEKLFGDLNVFVDFLKTTGEKS